MKTLEEIIREVYEKGFNDFEDIDRCFDPSEREDGIEEYFKEYWNNEASTILQDLKKVI